jgi:nucleotide-binding universal stress UspA family protein
MRILHPTDFSRTAEKARQVALNLARRTGGDLHVVHVQERFEVDTHRFLRPSLDTLNPELVRRVDEERNAEVRRIQERLRHLASEGGDWELRWGNAVQELLDASKKADVVVMGAHGANRLDAFFLGGIAGRVVRRSKIPVVTVREEAERLDLERVILATDFGDASHHAWKQLLPWHEHGIELVIAHVVDDPRFHGDSDYARRAADAMDEMGRGRAERHVLREGDPIRLLPALAEELDADAICVGVRRHAGAIGLLLGSRADALLRSSPVPIVSVPFHAGQDG